jgi:hypothetical protein
MKKIAQRHDQPKFHKVGGRVLYCVTNLEIFLLLVIFYGWGGRSVTPCAYPPHLPLLPVILFLCTTLQNGMTGISLHWAMGSGFSVAWQFSRPERLFFSFLLRL